MLSEYVQGNRVTVSAPFYNRVAVPIGVFLLFLTGIGPLLAWRSTSMKSIRKNFVLPASSALVVAIAVIPLGVHPWTIFTTDEQGAFYAWITFAMAGVRAHRDLCGVFPRRPGDPAEVRAETCCARWSS